MTPIEIKAAVDEIAAEFGRDAWVDVDIRNGRRYLVEDGIVAASCYPHGVGRDHCIRATSDTFEGVFAALREKIAEDRLKIHAAIIRKMALAIITITADIGECSDAALRGNGFPQSEIDKHGESACAEATRLAAGGPFEIVRLAALANAAE
jgi:hypothetical protein